MAGDPKQHTDEVASAGVEVPTNDKMTDTPATLVPTEDAADDLLTLATIKEKIAAIQAQMASAEKHLQDHEASNASAKTTLESLKTTLGTIASIVQPYSEAEKHDDDEEESPSTRGSPPDQHLVYTSDGLLLSRPTANRTFSAREKTTAKLYIARQALLAFQADGPKKSPSPAPQ